MDSLLKKNLKIENYMTDKEKIDDGNWANCYICELVFNRKRETKRYCYYCKKGICEGEHGTFQGQKFAICLVCYNMHKVKDN